MPPTLSGRGFRARAARALVRWVSRWMDASYAAWCRKDQGRAPDWWDRPWSLAARCAQRAAFPIARRLDRAAMVDQMCEECWWG